MLNTFDRDKLEWTKANIEELVVQVNIGMKHVACVTDAGNLYTWGEGSFGQLGHNNTKTKVIPTRVKSLTGIV